MSKKGNKMKNSKSKNLANLNKSLKQHKLDLYLDDLLNNPDLKIKNKDDFYKLLCKVDLDFIGFLDFSDVLINFLKLSSSNTFYKLVLAQILIYIIYETDLLESTLCYLGDSDLKTFSNKLSNLGVV